jgi:SH3-like domain-containing protein
MRKIKIVAALLLATIAGGSLVSETTSQTRPKINGQTDKSAVVVKALTKCNVQAYIRGIEPETANIRLAPDKNAALLKSLKSADQIVFYITGSDGKGWFEISKAETTGGERDEIIFEGRGWLHSSNADLSVAGSDAKLYAAPRKKSRVLKKLVVDASEARPVACQGDWMQVKSGKLTGWLSPEGQCANPLTTCS